MYTTHLRKVGGSIMLAVPPPLLDQLQLQIGATVGMLVDKGCLIIAPQPPRYSLDELLVQCDTSAELTDEDKEWLNSNQPMRAIFTILESVDKPATQKCSLHKFIGVLQHSSAFVGDPVAIQQAMRDEWN